MSSVLSVFFLCPLPLVTMRVFTTYGDVGLQWRWPHHQPSTMLCFFQRSFKCPWQGKRDTGETRERRGWHSHLQPVLNTALSPGQIAIPYVLLGQQRWGWEERGLHSPWQTLLPACGTQEVLLPQVEEEEENQDFSLIAVVLGLSGSRPTRGGISFHTVYLEVDSRSKTSSPATSWAALPCSTCRQNCTAQPPHLGSAHNFASALMPFPVAHPLHLLLNSHVHVQNCQ